MQVSCMCSLLEGSKRWTLSFQEVDKVEWLHNRIFSNSQDSFLFTPGLKGLLHASTEWHLNLDHPAFWLNVTWIPENSATKWIVSAK